LTGFVHGILRRCAHALGERAVHTVFPGWPGPGPLHRVRGAARFHRGGGARRCGADRAALADLLKPTADDLALADLLEQTREADRAALADLLGHAVLDVPDRPSPSG